MGTIIQNKLGALTADKLYNIHNKYKFNSAIHYFNKWLSNAKVYADQC